MDDFFFTLDDFEAADFISSGDNDHFNLDIEGDASGGTEYNDYIENSRDNMLIQALGGDDTIDNSGNEVIILGNEGNDLIFNTGERVLIAGGEGDDSVDNDGDEVIVLGGAGNDSISNSGARVSINGGAGDDTIDNQFNFDAYDYLYDYDHVIYIAGGEGNDSIKNASWNVLIKGGDGDDTITNSGGNVTIEGGAGDDLISNNFGGDRVGMYGGDGDDTIFSHGDDNPVVDGGAGDDYISNNSYQAKIDGGAGNDTIDNSNTSVSINGGAGNDLIYNNATFEADEWHENSTINGGTGNDTIYNSENSVTIIGGAGNDSIDNSGANVSINAGTGNDNIRNGDDASGTTILSGADDDSISNYAANASIDAGAGNDSVWNGGSDVTIDGGDGKDTIYSSGSNSSITIDGGNGNDYIRNSSWDVLIDGGAGNDSILNYGTEMATIDGGDGNDFIENGADSAIIFGGAGNDFIINGDSATLSGGKGNDTIDNDSTGKFLYTEGDGNDLIRGFNEYSTLQIGDGTGTYSTEIDGDDIIVTVGEGKITLEGAANLDSVNIDGEEIYLDPEWTLEDNVATYGTPKETLITVKGVISLDGLTADTANKVVTVADASLDSTEEVTVSNGYKLKLGSDVTQSKSVAAAYSKGVYTTKGTSAGYKLANNKISYVEGNTQSFTFIGVADGAAAKNFYVSTANNQIAIGAAAIRTDGTPIKLVSASDGKDYTLRLGNNMVSSRTLTAATYDSKTMTYRTKGITAVGYEVSSDGKSIKYNTTEKYAANTSKSFKFSGVADGATANNFAISTDNKRITIAKAAINTNGTPIKLESASDGGDYTLRLAGGLDSSKTYKKATYDSGSMTYWTAGITQAGYEVSEDGKSIQYNSAEAYEANKATSFKFSGVAKGAQTSNFAISTDNKRITIAKAAINTNGTPISLVSASDGGDYTLRLGSGMDSSRTLKTPEYDSKTMTYRTAGITNVGYEVSSDGKSITYNTKKAYAADPSNSFTFTGLTKKADADDFTVNAKTKTVAIKKEAVATNGTAAKLSTSPAGYKLALGSEMTAAVESKATYTAKTQTYTSEGITKAGYQLGSDGKSVSYQKATVLTFKFTGLTKKAVADDFTVNAKTKTVAIKAEAVATNGTAAKLSTSPTGYKLALGSDMTESSTVDSKWTFNNKKQTATYMGGGKTAGYTLADDGKSIAYSKKVAATSLATISGIESSGGLSVKGDIVTITSGLSKNVSVGSDSYGFKFAQKGYTKAKITGTENSDSIIASVGSRVTIDSGDGEDSIIASGKYTSINSNLGDNYVELGTGAGNSTVQLGAGNDTVSNKAGSVLIETKGGSDLIINTGANVTIDSGAGNDSIVSTGTDVTISGGAGADTLVGGTGNDTLSGGTGNDSLKGGEGADIFIYKSGEGNDIIADYNYDDGDIISLASGSISSSVLSGNNYIFTIGKGKLTVRNTKGKYIHFVDADENDIWPNGNPIPPVTIEGKKISVTESYMEDTFNVADYGSAFKTVDGSQVTHGLTINGYEKTAIRIIGTEEDDSISGGNAKDTLLGGDGNDSLSGGKGNDSLKGDAGADTFIYSNGDGSDIIADYEEEDTIKFAKGKVSKVLTASNGDVVFTVGSGKLTVQKAQDKIVTYEDAEGNRQFYPMNINAAGTAVTLSASYGKDEFNVADLGENASAIVTINASAVTHDLNITGNKLANNITGTEQNDSISGGAGADKLYGKNGEDTLVGGKGNDSLWGGAGADTFIYSNGDGTDYIKDYQSGIDTIMILSGTMSDCGLDTSGNVFCKVGNGKVVVENAANKYVEFVDRAGNKKQYIPQG